MSSTSGINSSLAPGDSASSSGRRHKPGKRERQERRANAAQAADPSKASAFASGAPVAPVPQPGKYPVVFQTGAGEPTRDSEFTFNHKVLGPVVQDLSPRFTCGDRYAEFSANVGLGDDEFDTRLQVAVLLSMAQQVVHAHMNMGLPQGDFSPVAHGDIQIPSSLRALVTQFGEFSVPALGTRFLLADYATTVHSLVWAAKQIDEGKDSLGVFERMWLPMSASGDKRSKTVIATGLREYLETVGVSVSQTALVEAVFSGTVPSELEAVKSVLGDPPGQGETDQRDRFDFLFRSWNSSAQLVSIFTPVAAQNALSELGLSWDNPNASHLQLVPETKVNFAYLADKWARGTGSFAKFFSLGSSFANRAAACGNASQMASVEAVSGVTIVSTHVALTVPEFSLAACFPPTGIFPDIHVRNVVVTTSIPIQLRATEFCQLDWN